MDPSISFSLPLIAQYSIAIVFVLSSYQKIINFKDFRLGVRDYHILPEWLEWPTAAFILTSEVVVAIAHVSGWQLFFIIPYTVVLLGIFSAAIIAVLLGGRPVPCMCLGVAGGELLSLVTLGRTVFLAALEIWLWFNVRAGEEQMAIVRTWQELLLASLGSACFITLARWAFQIGKLVRLSRSCKECADA